MKISLVSAANETYAAEAESFRPATGPFFRVLTDREIGRSDRDHLPMVFVFSEVSMPLDKYWQWYLCAINYGMDRKYITALLDTHKAFTNGTGFNDADKPRANWITGSNLSAPLPRFDKVRTCGNATLRIEGTVTMLDGRISPPIKPGYLSPQNISEAKENIYLYTPRTHPHLFYACVNSVDGDPRPFPNGALYSWYDGGRTPVTWLPHVSPVTIAWPLGYHGTNAPRVVAL